MAPDSGRHDADENATDRARIDYLAGEQHVELDAADQAELDELRALLADPTLWSEPPAGLEDSVVALIGAQVRTTTETPSAPGVVTETETRGDAEPPPFPVSRSPVAGPASAGSPLDLGAPPDLGAPLDLGAARAKREQRTGVRHFTRPVFLIAAAAVVVAVTVSGVAIVRSTTAPRQFDVALAATDLAPGAAGSATMLKADSGWEIQLDATGLPRRENGDFYQAWLRDGNGVLVPIGTFNEGEGVILWAGVSPEKFPTMTITLESADGNQDSSGQRVLVGTAVEQ